MTPDGRFSVRVFRQADRVLLRKCAEALSEDLGAEPLERFVAPDQIFWDFSIAGIGVTLHYKDGEGICVVGQGSSNPIDQMVRRTADHLGRRFADHVDPA
jgi:hypothetical protein